MKLFKGSIIVHLAVFLSLSFSVRGQFSFTTNNGAITITGYNGLGGAVSIPPTINGYPVTSIAQMAFIQNANLASVIIPDGVTNIGNYSFNECTSLTNVAIPESLASIGYAAFAYDPLLATIAVDPLNPVYTNVDGVLFDTAQTTLIQYPPSKPDAFYNVPGTVTNIQDSAFADCSMLTNVSIPASVTRLGNYVFNFDGNLAAITVDQLNPAYTSADGVLFDKAKTSLIQFPTTRAGSYSIPDSVTSIWDRAFFGSSSLTSVSLPNGLTSVGFQAFESCSNLTSITIPSSLSNIRDSDFQNCTGLTNATIPNGVTNIGSYAFFACSNLRSITIPASVSNIWGSAFSGCAALKTAFFLGNAPGIVLPLFTAGPSPTVYYLYGTTGWSSMFAGFRAFVWDPPSQLAYTITSGTISIMGYTGPGGKVSIPATINGLPVISIGNGAFYFFGPLTSITFPGSVTSIGNNAFAYCTNLTSIYCNGNAPTVPSNAFTSDTNSTIYYLPGTTGWHSPLGNRPAVLWNPQMSTSDGAFGVGPNGFGFNITGTAKIPILVEASAGLPSTSWTPLLTCALTNGAIYFSDPQWTNYPSRFYRIRSP